MLHVHATNPVGLTKIVGVVKQRARGFQPQFGAGTVASIAPKGGLDDIRAYSDEQIEAFRDEYIDRSVSTEAFSQAAAREVQYRRWQWALANTASLINMLRASGHKDSAIQAMLDGQPLCFYDVQGKLPGKAAFEEFCTALVSLGDELEKEQGWGRVCFVATGSSVVGFSQNPSKGKRDAPSWIAAPNQGTVYVCVLADGVAASVEAARAKGQKVDARATTCSPLNSAVRWALPEPAGLSAALASFAAEWSAKLPGALAFSVGEECLDLPPWEAMLSASTSVLPKGMPARAARVTLPEKEAKSLPASRAFSKELPGAAAFPPPRLDVPKASSGDVSGAHFQPGQRSVRNAYKGMAEEELIKARAIAAEVASSPRSSSAPQRPPACDRD